MNLNFMPRFFLDPRIAFGAFLVVFFFPLLGVMKLSYVLIILTGTICFYVGCFFGIKKAHVAWPKMRFSFALMSLIIGGKMLFLMNSLEFDFSAQNFTQNLINESVAQKSNVALGTTLNTIIALIFWLNLIGLCQKGKIILAISWLILFQVVSQQTGRFLIVSQVMLLVIIYCENNSRRINAVVVGAVLLSLIIAFPFLHAIRSGDISKDNLNVYGSDYISEIMSADVAPSQYFFDLVEYVDGVGYNYGKYFAFIPLQLIPRYIWPEKPTTSLQAVYTKEIYNIDHLDGVTFTFTIFDSYSYCGLVSIAMMSLFWGILFINMFYFYLSSSRPFMRIQFGLLLVNSFNFYRGNVTDFVAPILMGMVVAYSMDFIFSKNC